MHPEAAPARKLRRSCLPVLLFLSAWLLTGLCRIAGAQTPSSQPDPSQIKSHLKEVLSRPEFVPASSIDSPLQHLSIWLQERWDSFWRWVRELFGGVGGGRVGPGAVSLFVIVMIVLGLLLLAWLIKRYVGKQRANARSVFDMDDPEERMITEPDVWLQQAKQYAEEQDYRRSFRAVFLAILLQFDQAGIIEFDRSRTNGDYLRLLRSKERPELYEALRPLVLEFDLRWYGSKPTDEADYRRCLTEYHRLRELLAPSPQPAGAAQQTAPVAGKA